VRSYCELPPQGARIGLFGLLGSGNIANDAVLGYLQAQPPRP
jgi:hypothetical protein